MWVTPDFCKRGGSNGEDVVMALSSNGPTMSPRLLLLWVTDKRANYDRLYNKSGIHEHTRISRVPMDTASMCCVVSKYVCESVLISVSEVGLIGRSLAVVALN
jgi:hypothetical protein